MGRLGAILKMKLAKDIGDVILDGSFRQRELLSDFAVACSFGKQLQDLDLARAELFALWSTHLSGWLSSFAPELDQQLVGNFGLDRWLTSMNTTNSRHKFLSGYVFEQIAHSARFNGVKDVIFIVESSEDNNASGRIAVGDFSGGLDAIEIGHLNIHEHDIGPKLLLLQSIILLDSFFAVGSFADDLNTRFELKNGAQAVAHQGLILTQ